MDGAAERWRKDMFAQQKMAAKNALEEQQLKQSEKMISVIVDALDEFGRLLGNSVFGEHYVNDIIENTAEDETPTLLAVMKFETLWELIGIAMKNNAIDGVTPPAVYIDDFGAPIAVVAARGVSIFDGQ